MKITTTTTTEVNITSLCESETSKSKQNDEWKV